MAIFKVNNYPVILRHAKFCTARCMLDDNYGKHSLDLILSSTTCWILREGTLLPLENVLKWIIWRAINAHLNVQHLNVASLQLP